jgi:hypothetical protein
MTEPEHFRSKEAAPPRDPVSDDQRRCSCICHCRWCQRETGASFALNAMIEADRVVVLNGEPVVATPRTAARVRRSSAAPPAGSRCGAITRSGRPVRFVRVGTLDEPDRLPPDIHIFTPPQSSRVVLLPGTPAVAEYYDRDQYCRPRASNAVASWPASVTHSASMNDRIDTSC